MTTITLDELKALVGQESGLSPWRDVTQTMIDQFADATDDHQFIHCDPARAAAETPFGGTIAHGFLTLSLLSTFAFETSPQLRAISVFVFFFFFFFILFLFLFLFLIFFTRSSMYCDFSRSGDWPQ